MTNTEIVYYDFDDIHNIFSNYINWNRKDAVKKMKEIQELWQVDEFWEQLSVYKKEFQIEILSYFYNYSWNE